MLVGDHVIAVVFDFVLGGSRGSDEMESTWIFGVELRCYHYSKGRVRRKLVTNLSI